MAGLGLGACDTVEDTFTLNPVNPNEPTPEVLRTEEGLKRAAIGFYEAFDLGQPKNFIWTVQAYHELMGDALVTPWGNWQYRWVSQVTDVLLDDGTRWTPPDGGPQPSEIARVNSRRFDVESAVIEEWASMYFLNNQANQILEALDSGDISLTGDAAAKERGYRAWAHFWKGYAYSRIGSMYERGLILDQFGQTEGAFRDRADIIAEANRQFDLAIDLADGFGAVAGQVVPDLMLDSEVSRPTSETFRRAANTLKARNLLVNTRRAAMTQADWQQILDLTAQGLQSNTGTFVIRSDNVTYPDQLWHIHQAAWGPWGWHRVSERLIQDIQEGDARLANFEQTVDENGTPVSWNTRGRGIQFNSTWRVTTGSRYASQTSTEDEVKWYVTSFEENLLMRAEALLALGQPAEAAALIDQVRQYQNAGLAPVDPAGDVFEQLRSERRIGLFLRGLAFYDARRWGVLDPVSAGGGRAGAVVVDNSGVRNTNATINYNFLPYWPVPDEELTFNPGTPGGGGDGGRD